MTPEEVFAQLRDIHAPGVEKTLAGPLDPGPLIVFAGIVVLLVAVPRLRRWRARQALRARVRALASAPVPEQMRRLPGLLAEVPPGPGAPPEVLFRPVETVTPADADAVRRWLMQRLR